MRKIHELQKKYQALPALDLLLLVAHTVKKPKEWLITHSDYSLRAEPPPDRVSGRRLGGALPSTLYLLFRYYLWQYHRGYSVAAITKHKEFFGLDFFVNKNVLIPRPETELIVENVVNTLTTTPYSLRAEPLGGALLPTLFVDVGTGSGCIPIAIAKTIKQWNNGTIKIYATDISRRALRVARKNARTHNVSINFLQGNLLEPLFRWKMDYGKWTTGHLIITANLPYLTEQQWARESSIHREPRLALVADQDGLALYEQLLRQIKSLLEIRNWKLEIFLEIDPSQSPAITLLIKKYLPAASVEIKKDLAGRDRVVIIKINY